MYDCLLGLGEGAIHSLKNCLVHELSQPFFLTSCWTILSNWQFMNKLILYQIRRASHKEHLCSHIAGTRYFLKDQKYYTLNYNSNLSLLFVFGKLRYWKVKLGYLISISYIYHIYIFFSYIYNFFLNVSWIHMNLRQNFGRKKLEVNAEFISKNNCT